MRQATLSSGTDGRFVSFAIGGNQYCLNAESVLGLHRGVGVRLNRERPTDGTGPIGWLATNRDEYPIYELDARLGERAQKDVALNEVVLVRSQGEEWGFLVDQSVEIGSFVATRFFSLPYSAQSKAGFFDGAVETDGALTLHLSPSHIRRMNDAGTGKRVECDKSLPTFNRLESGSSSVTLSPIGSSSDVQAGTGRMFVFSVSMENVFFGVGLHQTLEALLSAKVTPVPAAAAYVGGVTLWRSIPTPIIDFGKIFGLHPPPPAAESRMLVLRGIADESVAAIRVCPEITTVKFPVSYRNASVGNERFPLRFTQAVFEIDRGILIIPNLDGILS